MKTVGYIVRIRFRPSAWRPRERLRGFALLLIDVRANVKTDHWVLPPQSVSGAQMDNTDRLLVLPRRGRYA